MHKIKNLLLTNTSTKQILFKNTFWLMAGEVIAKGLLFIVTISIVRSLGAEMYGKYASAVAFTAMFGVLVDFGLGTMLVQELSHSGKAGAPKLFSSILSLKLVLAALTFLAIIIASAFAHFPPDVLRLVYLSGIYMLVQSFVLIFPALFQAYESMQFSFLVRSGSNILLCVFVLLALRFQLSAPGVLYAYISTAVLMLIFTLILVKKRLFSLHFKIDKSMIKHLLQQSWPLFLGNVCATLYISIDTTMLSFMKSYKDVGIYQSSYMILYGFQTINLLHGALFPRMAELYKNNRSGLRKLLLTIIPLSLIILVPIVSFIGIFRNQIAHLIYGSRFVGVGDTMFILIIGGSIGHFSLYFSNLLLIKKRQIIGLFAVLFGLFVNVIANYFLISSFSYIGASIGYVSGYIAVLLFCILYR